MCLWTRSRENAFPRISRFRSGFSRRVDVCPRLSIQPTQDDSGGQLQYKAAVEFDRDEFWRVRLVLESSQGRGEEFSRVEATPVGFGKWDLLFFLLPFLLIAFLWLRGMSRRRNRMKKSTGRIDVAAAKRRKIAAHGVSVDSDLRMASPEGAKESFAGERKRT